LYTHVLINAHRNDNRTSTSRKTITTTDNKRNYMYDILLVRDIFRVNFLSFPSHVYVQWMLTVSFGA